MIFQVTPEQTEEFQTLKPFNHIVFDEFLHPQDAMVLDADFPLANDKWYTYQNTFEKKRACDKTGLMPQSLRDIFYQLNSSSFVHWLEILSGIKGLIPDPHFRGGGLHSIDPGGHLDIHEDFSIHPDLKLYRRLNVLIYLNHDTKNKGGELELWDRDMTKCVKKIEPKFNRCVIFRTDQKSNHGHPNPWLGSECRRSIATYYYTSTHEQSDLIKPHSTLFKKRPNEETNAEIEALREKRNRGRIG